MVPPEAAWEPFGRVLREDPERIEALYYRARILWLRNDYREAELLLKQVLSLDPKHAAAHFKLAQVYTRLGEMEAASRHRERYQSLRAQYSTHLKKVIFRIP